MKAKSNLVLSRKEGEVIDIGNGAFLVTVAKIRGNAVRLMITADRDIPIVRGELIANK